MGSHSDCTLPSSVPDCLALSILPPSYLLLSLFIYLAILARALSDDSATFLMVRFPGNLRQVLCSLPPSRLPSPLLAQFCENGRGGGGANQSDVSVGGRSNAVVYARVGLSYIATAKYKNYRGARCVPQNKRDERLLNYHCNMMAATKCHVS